MKRLRLSLLLLASFPAAAQVPVSTPYNERIAAIRKLIRDGKPLEAERQARAELSALESAGLGETADAARTMDHLVEALWVNGKHADPETKALAERALHLKEKLFGPEHPEFALSLKWLAQLSRLAGDYVTARPMVERALAIERKAFGPEDPRLGATLTDLAVILYGTGDFPEAKRLLEEALPLTAKQYGPESAPVAQNLNDLAVMHWKLGDFQQAKTLHERALAMREKVLAPDHFQVAASLNNLSLVLQALHDLRGAARLQERALAIRQKSLGPEHPNTANGLNNLAFMYLELQEYDKARKLLERSLDIREKVYGPRHWLVAQSLMLLARALRAEGQPRRALDVALQSEEIMRSHLRAAIRGLSEREAAASLALRFGGLDISLGILAGGGAPAGRPREIWDSLIRSRSLVFDEMASRRHAVADADDLETAARAGQLDRARAAYARLLIQGPGKQGAARHAAALDEARHEMESAERALAERSRELRNELAQARAGFTEVAASLPAGSALVAYVDYQPEYLSEEKAYLAFVLGAGQRVPAAVPIGDAKRIDGLITAWRAQISREAAAPGRSAKRNDEECRQAGIALRRAVWDPVEAHLGRAKRVFLVQDGALHLVNFGALPVTPDAYLIERGPLLHVLNTERDLVRQDAAASGQGLLALGDPDFQFRAPSAGTASAGLRGAACPQLERLEFERLPQSALEVKEVAAIWDRSGGLSLVLRSAAATEEALRQAAPGKRVLHLATHGFFLPAQCDPKVSSPQPDSGLALAGANRRGAADAPGILTAEEVPSLKLEGVEWAVLSGCDTGLGAITAGEGVFGLRRAFQIAGVRTVIMSLWPVQDEAARQWMKRLYRARFLSRQATAEAVRAASAGLLRERRAQHLSTHPFYWAGFIAAGDWR